MSKKIQTILSLIEISEVNLKNAKNILATMMEDQGRKQVESSVVLSPGKPSREEDEATSVVEGYFDGEYMIGDNGQSYVVPPNYASKTQLIIGDRMKWILTSKREIFKLIQPAERLKVEGVFVIEGDNYMVLVEQLANPVKILKASATFAIKNHGLQVGEKVSLLIPKNSTPSWGALVSVLGGAEGYNEEISTYEQGDKNNESGFNIMDEFDQDSVFIPESINESKTISKGRSKKQSEPVQIISDEDYL